MSTSTTHNIKAHIRWMIRRDMPEVLSIADACFEHPWTEADFLEHLRERSVIGMVAERGDLILGYMIYSLERTAIHLHNLAVDPEYQRHQIGRQLVSKLIGKLCHNRRYRLMLKCRESNLAACKFYRSCGLKATGILRGRYTDTGEDAYVFEYRLPVEG